MENLEATGRISKWALELRSDGLRYELRTTIKGQVLADFISEFIPGATVQADQLEGWTLNLDRASNSKGQAFRLFSPLQNDLSLNSPLPSFFQRPTMKPSTRQFWLDFERLSRSGSQDSKFSMTPH